jgi:hypothetical protein
LNLLKSDADGLAELRLADPQPHATAPDPGADVPIDGIRAVF